MVIIAEYIWIDGTGTLRSKSRTMPVWSKWSKEKQLTTVYDAKQYPKWNFDGSSTKQAKGNDSEIILIPVAVYDDPFRTEGDVLVMCECVDKNMKPIESNSRAKAMKIFDQVSDHHPWFGLEQEYVLYNNKTGRPLGWPSDSTKVPEPQGKYYCGVGAGRVFGRYIIERHYRYCLIAGIKISGINAEVMPGQWEFQVGPCEGISSGDQLWIARYILERVAEEEDVYISYDPKPEKGDWNGSGCHANYSTSEMREDGGINYILLATEALALKHKEPIDVYGDNSKRLIGTHETSSKDKFTYGVGDRTASVRIPTTTVREQKGYIEDRRPASDCDPYVVTSIIAETTLL